MLTAPPRSRSGSQHLSTYSGPATECLAGFNSSDTQSCYIPTFNVSYFTDEVTEAQRSSRHVLKPQSWEVTEPGVKAGSLTPGSGVVWTSQMSPNARHRPAHSGGMPGNSHGRYSRQYCLRLLNPKNPSSTM